jgi:hypothetical protein
MQAISHADAFFAWVCFIDLPYEGKLLFLPLFHELFHLIHEVSK